MVRQTLQSKTLGLGSVVRWLVAAVLGVVAVAVGAVRYSHGPEYAFQFGNLLLMAAGASLLFSSIAFMIYGYTRRAKSVVYYLATVVAVHLIFLVGYRNIMNQLAEEAVQRSEGLMVIGISLKLLIVLTLGHAPVLATMTILLIGFSVAASRSRAAKTATVDGKPDAHC